MILAVSESVGSFGLFLVAQLEAHSGFVQVALCLLFAVLLALWLRRPRLRAGILLPMSLLLVLFFQLRASAGAPDSRDGILLDLAYVQLLLCAAISSGRHRSTARTEVADSNSRSSASSPTTPARAGDPSWRWRLVALVVLVAAAAPIRFWRLAEYPKFFSGEYASWTGVPALRILEGKKPIALLSALDFTTGQYMDSSWVFFPDLVAVSFLAFGNTITAMRLVPTCFGILSVFLIGYVGRRWLDSRVGFAAAILLAVSPVMIGMSRELHTQVAFLVPFSLLLFHFLLESLETPRFRNFLMASALTCFAFHLYRPALISVPLVLGFWGYSFVTDRAWRAKAWRPLCLSAPLSALLLIPPLYYQLSGRFEGYAALLVPGYGGSAEMLRGMADGLADVWQRVAYDGSPILFGHGVGSYIDPAGTLYLPVVAALFFIGVGHCAVRCRERRAFQVLLALAVCGLLPAVLSSALSRRMIVFAPPFFLLAGCGAAFLFSPVSKLPGKVARSCGIVLVGLAVMSHASVGWGVFMDMARTAKADPSRELSEEIARAIKSDEMVVTLFRTDSIRSGVKILAADRYRMREVNGRFWSAKTLRQLRQIKSASLPPSTHITFVVRVEGTQPTVCSIAQMDQEMAKHAATRTRWQSKLLGGEDARVSLQYYLLRAPIADFAEIWRWARACF
jgi:hypothetical protein